MPRPVLTMAATMQCPHGMKATPIPATVQVLVGGAPPLVQGDQALVAGCPFTVPPGKPQPCVTAELRGAASKVLIGGKAALLLDPGDLCKSADRIVNGPVVVASVQSKVLAT